MSSSVGIRTINAGVSASVIALLGHRDRRWRVVVTRSSTGEPLRRRSDEAESLDYADPRHERRCRIWLKPYRRPAIYQRTGAAGVRDTSQRSCPFCPRSGLSRVDGRGRLDHPTFMNPVAQHSARLRVRPAAATPTTARSVSGRRTAGGSPRTSRRASPRRASLVRRRWRTPTTPSPSTRANAGANRRTRNSKRWGIDPADNATDDRRPRAGCTTNHRRTRTTADG